MVFAPLPVLMSAQIAMLRTLVEEGELWCDGRRVRAAQALARLGLARTRGFPGSVPVSSWYEPTAAGRAFLRWHDRPGTPPCPGIVKSASSDRCR